MGFRYASVATRFAAVILLLFKLLEWRNWQTHGTQNPAGFTSHVGSTPTSSTTGQQQLDIRKLRELHAAGLGLHGIADQIGWSLSVIMQTLRPEAV